MAIHPYLMFGGNCREAFNRYEEIFGGELVLLTMDDMPAGADAHPHQGDLIMHAALTFGDNLLMASDDASGDFESVRGMAVNYSCSDVAEAQRIFDGLAEGGTVTMAMEPTFWSPSFGMCVDRFGTPWMINAQPADAGDGSAEGGG